ncbi:MAG: glycosyltransferase family 8 protein [Treponema sp.]|nr:glycosyltransferase family 8 protein [Treponema sp.]
MNYNLVYISDDNYIIPTKASVNSIKKSCFDVNIDIYIIAVEVSEKKQKELLALSTNNIKIQLINVKNEFKDLGQEHKYISKADLFKFKLPYLFENFDKILYVDGDMIMNREFLKIFDYDIHNVYGAFVMDMFVMEVGRWHEKLGHEKYFNGGMMYLNLAKMREDNISEKLIEYKKNDTCTAFMDQNALNAIMGSKALYIHPKYNFLESYIISKRTFGREYSIKEFADFYGISENEMKETFCHPAILHLAGRKKAWKSAQALNYDTWIKYVDSADYFEVTCAYIKSLNDDLNELRSDLKKLKNRSLWGFLTNIYHLIKK